MGLQVETACGSKAADYLARAVGNFEKFGKVVEVIGFTEASIACCQ